MISRKVFVILMLTSIATISIILANTFAITGFFSKAFDKTLSPGEQYGKNITIRQFYNLTVRFQKETSSTTYLTFDSNDTVIVLKDATGNEVARNTGVINAKMYFLIDKTNLDRITTVSALNLGDYEDVIDQQANKTFSGTTSYITVKVHNKPPLPARIFGSVTDELTGNAVQSAFVAAFDDNADTSIATPINSSLTDVSGRYSMQFDINVSKALDVYVRDYEVS